MSYIEKIELTSKIISTMIAEGMPLETCVSTIAATLPVSSDRGVAYSTFTIIHLVGNHTAEIIRYDNPDVIFIRNGELYEKWSFGRDGASMICRLLFEEATDINFYVGRAVNPAHQNPDLPISFHLKMNMVEELSEDLEKMGKRVKVSCF